MIPLEARSPSLPGGPPRAHASWARRVFRPVPLLFAALFVFYVAGQRATAAHPETHYPLIHGDGVYTYAWARSLAYDLDLKLDDDYALCGDPWGKRTPVAPGLEPQNTWSPGPMVVWAPLIWIARALVPAAAHSTNPQIAGGCTGPIADVAMAGSAAMAVGALIFAYALARRYVSRGAALFGVGTVALASPLPYYAMVAPAYGHTAAAFWFAVFLERWDATRGRRTTFGWAWLGLLLGVAMLTRSQAVVIAAPVAIEWALPAWRDARARRLGALAKRVGQGLLFVGIAVVVFSPQLRIWKAAYGHYFTIPMGAEYMRWGHPNLDGTLFSMLSGLLPWSPLLYASFFGVLFALRPHRTRVLAASLALLLALELYVNASVWDYWGSGGYPARRFTEMALPFAAGAALFADAFVAWVKRRPRVAANVALGVTLLFGAIWTEHAPEPTAETSSAEVFGKSFLASMRSVRDAVGDPLAWPASIPFALRYRCHPRRYDRMNGYTVFYENWFNLKVDRDTLSLTSPEHEDFVVDDFAAKPGAIEGEPGRLTTGPAPRLLIPAFRGTFDRIAIRWIAVDDAHAALPVAITWNGKSLGTSQVPAAWTKTELRLPHGAARAGVNEVVFSVPQGAIGIATVQLLQMPLPAGK